MLLTLLLAVTAIVDHGNIVVRRADGTTRTVTSGGGYDEPTVSPDGRRVAFTHEDAPGEDDYSAAKTSLWVADVAGGAPRRLLASRFADDPQRNLESCFNPRWSLDGSFVYLDCQAWATSSAIHQVDAATGRERYVVHGWSYGVVRTGPWRGYLLVAQHRYFSGPEGGSYNPVFLIRPDGKIMRRLPGKDEEDGEQVVPRWLKAHGWTAS